MVFHCFVFQENCTNQQDYFDSDGHYWKTVCTITQNSTRKTIKSLCEAQQMTLASTDDFEGGEAILIHRFKNEFPSGGTVWIGGKFSKYCSAIVSLPGGAVIRQWRECDGLYAAYCEFNGNFCFR